MNSNSNMEINMIDYTQDTQDYIELPNRKLSEFPKPFMFTSQKTLNNTGCVTWDEYNQYLQTYEQSLENMKKCAEYKAFVDHDKYIDSLLPKYSEGMRRRLIQQRLVNEEQAKQSNQKKYKYNNHTTKTTPLPLKVKKVKTESKTESTVVVERIVTKKIELKSERRSEITLPKVETCDEEEQEIKNFIYLLRERDTKTEITKVSVKTTETESTKSEDAEDYSDDHLISAFSNISKTTSKMNTSKTTTSKTITSKTTTTITKTITNTNTTNATINSYKTRICESIQQGVACRHGAKCRYAHSPDELNLVECHYRDTCKNPSCTFSHGETTAEYYDRVCGVKVQEPKPVHKNPLKTRMCQSVEKGIVCKFGKSCNFAHNVSELVIIQCKYGKSCNNNKCTFSH